MLARNCGLEESADLFSQELETLLKELKEDFETWNRHSADRFVFDMLVRRSNTAVVDYWDEILEIVASCTEREKDFELRMDMLSLIEHFLKTESLHSTIVFYTEIMLKLILIPSMQWAVGIPSQSIRKAAVVCTMTLLNKNLIETHKLYQNFQELHQSLKNCLDDDWVAELRWAGVILVRKMMEYVREEIDYEDFKEVYPELLKRLDDSQDGIRVETAKNFEVFFELMQDPWSGSLYDYTVRNIFIHLDDSNPQVSDAITKVLKKAATKHTQQFIEIANDCQMKSPHPLLCKNLETYARELKQ